ncbi:hypothetical protein CFN78_24005 [Amycolatopsis antarctica]|uniref:Uncharacterized protein n=1 Tax=Amycolatopsis antarctica TaxID=1854586 RepID=A0A263CX67_9PSEU|nr:hypothetical protein [Amycolatopsis antarctica]OZM70732.1 hypothetical protein CFN78_24005 [Amycolatopsis antarctica]
MPTDEEIERRVAEADAPRSAKRSAAAQRVGDLAARHAEIAAQLNEVERELGEVLAESSDVIDIDELAQFTEVPATDLARWLDTGNPASTKRKKPANSGSRAKKALPPPKTTAAKTVPTPRPLAAAPTPTADSPAASVSVAQ